jgi:hypothetical protein
MPPTLEGGAGPPLTMVSSVTFIPHSPAFDRGKGVAGDDGTSPSEQPKVPVLERIELQPGEGNNIVVPLVGNPNICVIPNL